MHRVLIYKIIAAMSTLHVAEKNSIAKEVANILSNSRKTTGVTLSKYNPIYEFELNNTPMKFTSVRGHIFEYQLPEQCKNWTTYDNKRILSMRHVSLIKTLGNDMSDVVRNLQKLAREHKELVLWLDCDRQGEAIAFQVLDICTKINPRLKIQRAKFAAVTPTDIWNAYNNLVKPNKREADAVNFRMEIDMRMGCTFTRYQTTLFQKYYQLMNKTVLSYGPCQMPTLSFVVNRYLQIKYFKPEKYWVLEASCVIDNQTAIPFTWMNKNTKDETLAHSLLVTIIDQFEDGNVFGTVISRKNNPKKKYRPYPLTTVAFQKLATDKLKMSSAKAMQIAEKLYQKGLISYPRTETNAFPKTMNLKQIISRFHNSESYHEYIGKLLHDNKYMNPKVGSGNDQAHTPIHPVKLTQLNNLAPEQRKVYDLICRHFFACCSKDATGEEYEVRAEIGGEEFKASYLTILEKNYLEIYPYQKWSSSSFPAQVPDKFPAIIDLRESQTTPPSYLTQAQLIDQMEKNQIGTDSTIHEHIQTIQKRQYAVKTQNTFKPTNLGASLIQTYRRLRIQLPECEIRRNIEQCMNRIAEGEIEKEVATKETLQGMQPLYDKLQERKVQWIQALKECMEEFKDLKNVGIEQKQEGNYSSNYKQPIQICKCPLCKESAYARYSSKSQSYFIGCSKYPTCKWIQSLPTYIEELCEEENNCSKCNNKLVKIKAKPGATIFELVMRIKISESQDLTVSNMCLAPGCDRHFYENIDQYSTIRFKDFKEQKSQNKISRADLSRTNHMSQERNRVVQRNQNNSNTFTNQNKTQIICYRCKQIGHIAPNCPNTNSSSNTNNFKNKNYQKKNVKISSNYTSNSIRCFKCQQVGHIAPQCPNTGNRGPKIETQKQKKVCPVCGVEGRHPRNSQCPNIKRRNKSKNTENSDED